MSVSRSTLLTACLAMTGIGGWWMLAGDGDDIAQVNGVRIPTLTEKAREGASLFAQNCAGCHGDHASGGEGGPPLIHIIYEPSHHPDRTFYSAVKNGVRQHHWRFGNMPPINGVDEDAVAIIVAYLREVQRANGIE